MTTIEFEVYKSEDGSFSRKSETRTANPSTRHYLMSTMSDEEKQAFLSRSSKQNKQRLYRAGKSEGYRQYCEENKTVYNSFLYGKVTAEYDGRLREGSVIVAILHALKDNSQTMRVEPASNANKPAHLQMVYIKEFFVEVYK